MKSRHLIGLCFFALAILSLPFDAALCATYYVKNSGDDSASGLCDSEAWRTISKVNRFEFSDGDTVRFRRGDIFNDETVLDPGVDNFTMEDYGQGSKPLFDGDVIMPVKISRKNKSPIKNLTIRNIDISGQDWKTYIKRNIKIINVNGLLIAGVEGNGHRNGNISGQMGKDAINIHDCSGTVEVKNCRLFNWGHPDLPKIGDIGTVGIRVSDQIYGTILIHDNVIHDINADCVQILRSTASTKIYSNVLYNGGENSIDVKGSDNVEIYDNEFFRTDGFGVGGEDVGALIVVHGVYERASHNTIIRDNFFHDSGYGNEWGGIRLCSSGGNTVFDTQITRNRFVRVQLPICVESSDNTNISYNLIVNPLAGSECWGGDCAAIYVKNGRPGTKIVNNTIYNHTEDIRYPIFLKYTRDAQVKYNIVYHNNDAKGSYVMYWSGEGKAPLIECNNWYNVSNDRRIRFAGSTYSVSDLDAWRSLSKSGDLFGEPVFNDVGGGDFSLGESLRCGDRILGAVGVPSGIAESCTVLRPPYNIRIVGK